MSGRLIGLIGRKRSGKDTFAGALIAERNYKRFAFADNVRQAMLDLDPFIVVTQDEYGLLPLSWALPYPGPYVTRLSHLVGALGWEAAKELREVRRSLQRFGSESIRRLDPEFWVRTVMDEVREHPGDAVITDVRFPNEADAVRAAGGTLVRIIRPGVASDDEHISETALDDFAEDITVKNVSTIDFLCAMARSVDRSLS